MTTTILLIRHGFHDLLGRMLCGRMPGVSLNDAGAAQAVAVADRLASRSLDAVYCSPLERARETAAPIAARAGVDVQIDPRLDEVDFGRWSGLSFDELDRDPAWTLWNEARSRHRPPGGETIHDVQVRTQAWVADMAVRHPGETVAAVSHADVIKALVLHILRAPIDMIHSFEVGPASATRMEVGDRTLRLIGLNESCP